MTPTLTLTTYPRRAVLVIALVLITFTAAHAETVTYDYDPNGNLLLRQRPQQTDTAGYDADDRMTLDISGDGLTRQFQYDANGNRTNYQVDTFSEPLTYAPNTNRLTLRDTQAIQTDPSGNLTDDGQYLYTYNRAGRLSQLTRKSDNQLLATYTYNAEGQRTRKVTQQGTTLYHYDTQGHLILETDTTGTPKRTYVWLNERPLAQLDPSGILYLHTDPLDTPRLATNTAGQTIWRWEGQAFGASLPNEDVDNDGIATIINLRFAGQYFDQESGLHYNWNRYYDPNLGRYITSDPIGLRGGLNTYAYVENNPLRWTDPRGLCPCNGGVWDQEFGDSGFNVAAGGIAGAQRLNLTCKSNPNLKCRATQYCVGGGAMLAVGFGFNLVGTVYGANDSNNLGGWSDTQMASGFGPIGVQAPIGEPGGSVTAGPGIGGGIGVVTCYTKIVSCSCPCGDK